MQVVNAYTEGQRKEIVKIEELVPRVLKQIQNQANESEGLRKDDGSPNIESIKRYAIFILSSFEPYFQRSQNLDLYISAEVCPK